jgi:hypothetical protein
MYSRISSANSIRRPIVRQRNLNTTPLTTATTPPKPPQPPPPLLQLQQETIFNNQENTNNIKLNSKETFLINDEKPPAYPSANTLLIGNVGSYALLSQKKKEYQTKNQRLNSDRSVNSPKTTPINNLVSPSSQQPNNNNNNLLDQQNTKVSNMDHVNNNNFYNNIKYNEMSYREYQASRLNNDLGTHQHDATTPTTINIMNQNATKFRLNNTEPNLFRRNSNSSTSGGDENVSLINKKPIETYTLTRIPLSPKSNLKANYYFTPQMLNSNSEKRQQYNNEPSPPTAITTTTTTKFFLASGSATPLATTTTIQNGSNGQLYNIPKTNIKFAYLNSTTNNINGIQNQISINPQLQNHFLGQRASSADNANHNFRLNTQQSNFENKYPLYSNYQAQYINIAKGLNIGPQNGINHIDNHTNNGHNLPVNDSMALFLKAEEMAYKESTTESQIINAVKEINNNKISKRVFFFKYTSLLKS